MNRYPLWKYILVLAALLLGLVYSIPNIFGEAPAVQIKSARPMNKLDTSSLKAIESLLKAQNIKYDQITFDDTGIKIRLANTDTQIKTKDILVGALGKDYTVALNMIPSTPTWLVSIHALPIKLGLDLRGGVHFLLQVDMKAALDKAAERYVGDFRVSLRKERISYSGVTREGQRIEVKFTDASEMSKAEKILGREFADLIFKESDKTLIATLSPTVKKQIQEFALKQNIQTLHNRINKFGVAEPIIQQQGLDRVVVQLPGVQDTAKAKEILGRTTTLEVRLVDEEKSDPTTLEQASKGQVPIGDEFFLDRNNQPLLIKKRVELTGEYITKALPGVDQRSGGATVNLTLDARGARLFRQVTKDNVGKRMAMLLVEKGQAEVITAPVINEEIGGGNVQISGMANAQESTDISLLLSSGSLAAPMDIVEERTVGPSMGEENIKRGMHSTMWGFAAIAVFMMLYYLVFGGISVIALGVNLVLLVAILSPFATLTLPGLAAIALTLGMAIDANVLINERIREELRNGNSPQSAIHAGYDRAFDTILDSNVTTLIAGLSLLWLGSGPVKGFAVVHVLGILTSMFSAVLVSRAIVNLAYGYRRKINKLAIG